MEFLRVAGSRMRFVLPAKPICTDNECSAVSSSDTNYWRCKLCVRWTTLTSLASTLEADETQRAVTHKRLGGAPIQPHKSIRVRTREFVQMGGRVARQRVVAFDGVAINNIHAWFMFDSKMMIFSSGRITINLEDVFACKNSLMACVTDMIIILEYQATGLRTNPLAYARLYDTPAPAVLSEVSFNPAWKLASSSPANATIGDLLEIMSYAGPKTNFGTDDFPTFYHPDACRLTAAQDKDTRAIHLQYKP